MKPAVHHRPALHAAAPLQPSQAGPAGLRWWRRPGVLLTVASTVLMASLITAATVLAFNAGRQAARVEEPGPRLQLRAPHLSGARIPTPQAMPLRIDRDEDRDAQPHPLHPPLERDRKPREPAPVPELGDRQPTRNLTQAEPQPEHAREPALQRQPRLA